jgi:hypothetical protein
MGAEQEFIIDGIVTQDQFHVMAIEPCRRASEPTAFYGPSSEGHHPHG